MWNIDLGQVSVNFMSDTTVRVAIALLDFTASCLSNSSKLIQPNLPQAVQRNSQHSFSARVPRLAVPNHGVPGEYGYGPYGGQG